MMVARDLFLMPLKVVHTPTGRRLIVLAALAIGLSALVTSLYDHAEQPAAPARAQAGVLVLPVARPAPAASRRSEPSVRPASGRPADVAVAWYAAKHHVGADRVRPLQQQRLSADEVQVLVMAETGSARLDSAFVRLKRSASGWTVG